MRSQFILHLQQFSDSLLARTQEMNAQLDDLVGSVKATDYRIRNTFNEFLMLANNQFIENVRTWPIPARAHACHDLPGPDTDHAARCAHARAPDRPTDGGHAACSVCTMTTKKLKLAPRRKRRLRRRRLSPTPSRARSAARACAPRGPVWRGDRAHAFECARLLCRDASAGSKCRT